MAISVLGSLGSTQSKTAQTSWSGSFTNDYSADTTVIVAIALDNVTTTDTSTSLVTAVALGNAGQYAGTKLHEYTNGNGSAAAGATVSVWMVDIPVGATSSAAFTVSLASSVTAKAITAHSFSAVGGGLRLFEVYQTQGASDGSPAGVLSVSGLPASTEYLIIRAIAGESNSTTALTPSTGWNVFGDPAATSGGSGATNMAVRGEFDVDTNTSFTSAPVSGLGSVDSASVVVVLKEIAQVSATFTADAVLASGGGAPTTVSATFTANAVLRKTPSAPRKYGVLIEPSQVTTTNANDLFAKGITHVIIPAYWDRLQGTDGGSVTGGADWTEFTTAINNAYAAGLKVSVNFSIQYPPAWAKTGIAKFRNQNSEDFADTVNAGKDVRDWIWTTTGQAKVSDFYTKVIAGISAGPGLSKIDSLRVGTGYYGEVQYPNRDGYTPAISYWGYGVAPQTGTGLASNQTVCPLPGYVPFVGGGGFTQSDANDTLWIDWYLDAQSNAVKFLIDTQRSAGWTGDIYVLHPSFGIRSNWTSIASPSARPTAYRWELQAGVDPKRLIQAYKFYDNVWPYSTWIEGSYAWTPPSADSDYPAWYKLYNEAALVGKERGIWGETSVAGAPTSSADYVFDYGQTYIGPLELGYSGVVWFNYGTLTDGGGDTSLTYLSNKITTATPGGPMWFTAAAFLAFPSFTFTANAILRTIVPQTFTSNAILKKTASGTFTSDSVLRAIQSATFSSDAILRKAIAFTFTSDAILLRIIAAAFTSDAVLKKTTSTSFTADSVLFKTTAGTFTSDSILRRIVSGTFTADAVIQLLTTVVSGSFTANAILFKSTSATWTADAITRRVEPFAFTSDSILRRIVSATFTADAYMVNRIGATFTSDAILRAIVGPTFTADSVLRRIVSFTFTADATLANTTQGSFAANAILRWTIPGTFTSDAIIRKTQPFTFTADSVTRRTESFTFVSAAILRAIAASSFTADAVLFKQTVGTFTADAYLLAVRTGSFTSDAILKKTLSATFTADSILKATLASTFTADAWLVTLIAGQGAFSADAILRKTAAANFTADAYMVIRTANTFVASAILRQQYSITFTTDAILKAVSTGTFTGDAVLRRSVGFTFTADSVLLKATPASISADAILRTVPAGSFTSDAILKKSSTGSFAADAILKKTTSSTFTADAFLLSASGFTFTADAVLKATSTYGFAADAILSKEITNSFTVDALLTVNSTGSFTADAILRSSAVGSFSADALIKGTTERTFTADAFIVGEISGVGIEATASVEQTMAVDTTAESSMYAATGVVQTLSVSTDVDASMEQSTSVERIE